jgi:Flp pilus assembly protein TadD
VFILLALVGAIATVSLHTTIASASSNRQVGSVVRAGGLGLYSREFHSPGLNLTAKQSESNSPSPQLLAPNLSDRIQQGKELYQAGQFSEAVTAWQKAAAMFEAQGDVLNQALTLSFVASAFEQLGQWTEATKAITQSLQLLSKQQTTNKR